tara:strand:+ start:901 stop:1149 length:249 start_codon:yes stop_codon:yes gene_type:complete
LLDGPQYFWKETLINSRGWERWLYAVFPSKNVVVLPSKKETATTVGVKKEILEKYLYPEVVDTPTLTSSLQQNSIREPTPIL